MNDCSAHHNSSDAIGQRRFIISLSRVKEENLPLKGGTVKKIILTNCMVDSFGERAKRLWYII